MFSNEGLDMRRVFTVADAISDLANIRPGPETEIMTYKEEWLQTDYQRWCRGLISTEELFKRREFPWVNRDTPHD